MRIVSPAWAVVAILVVAAVAAGSPARAIGPDLPLRFRDSFERLEILIDPATLGELSVSSILYDQGKVIREERLAVRPERKFEGDLVAEIPLDLDRSSDLERGYYALKIVAIETPPKGVEAEPLRIEQWIHLLVTDSGVFRVTQEEYSGAVDPVSVGLDSKGERVLLHEGSAAKADVPLDKTEHSEAPAIGLGGGAVEERTGEELRPKSRDESQEP